MPGYIYEAVDDRGQVKKGRMSADSMGSFYKALRNEGQYCIKVKEVASAELVSSDGNGKGSIKPKELSIICKQMAIMLNSGITIIKCIDILYNQTEKPATKKVLWSVYENIQQGHSLSSAMRKQNNAFPTFMLNMIEAGEASGNIDSVMQKLADFYEKDVKLKNKITAAMIYPIILLCVSVVVVATLLVFVMPQFTGMFESAGADLPATTKILIGMSDFLQNYWYVVLIGGVLLVAAYKFLTMLQPVKREFDKIKLDIPKVGKLYKTVVAARFARTMFFLFSSGLSLIKSIELTARVIGNAYLDELLIGVKTDIQKGIPMSVAIQKIGVFPSMLISMLSIGEQAGSLEEVMSKTADFYDEESDAAITKMVSMLEPLMIVMLAGVIGFVVISILQPMMGMYDFIG